MPKTCKASTSREPIYDSDSSINSGSLVSFSEPGPSRGRSPSSSASSNMSGPSCSSPANKKKKTPVKKNVNPLQQNLVRRGNRGRKKNTKGVDRIMGKKNEIIYLTKDDLQHKVVFKNKSGRFKSARIPNKACSYLLSHCSKTHPLMGENKKHTAFITIKKRNS